MNLDLRRLSPPFAAGGGLLLLSLLVTACATEGVDGDAEYLRRDGSMETTDSGGGGRRDSGLPGEDAGVVADAGGGEDAGGPVDSGTPIPGDRGVVTVLADAPCSGTVEGRCITLEVDCSAATGVPPIQSELRVREPSGPYRGTVVHYSGGGGTTWNEYGNYRPSGLRSVEVRYLEDWSATANGVLAGACRPATVLFWVFENIHGADRGNGFCAHGFSGGSAQISYSLAHYNAEEILDYANLVSGPPYGRIDYGCSVADLPTAPTLCGGASGPLPYHYSRLATMRARVGDACGRTSQTAADLEAWRAMSIMSDGVDLDFPLTPVGFFYCTSDTANEVTGQGSFFANAVTSTHTVGCYTSCAGEGVTADPMAATDIQNGMLTNCVPRH